MKYVISSRGQPRMSATPARGFDGVLANFYCNVGNVTQKLARIIKSSVMRRAEHAAYVADIRSI
jgi:hypothetical protein